MTENKNILREIQPSHLTFCSSSNILRIYAVKFGDTQKNVWSIASWIKYQMVYLYTYILSYSCCSCIFHSHVFQPDRYNNNFQEHAEYRSRSPQRSDTLKYSFLIFWHYYTRIKGKPKIIPTGRSKVATIENQKTLYFFTTEK